ncbi:hypothetical protein C0J52_10245, partial [Blattella germanica]
MTTKARNKDKRFGIQDQIKVATWNVRGLQHKEPELERELKEREIDIAIISETKKKQRGSYDLKNYTVFYSGVDITERAQAGVAILINNNLRNLITSYQWINQRIIEIRCKIP